MNPVNGLAAAMLAGVVSAQEPPLSLMRLFSNHMVLPSNSVVEVKGRAGPGAAVSLRASWLGESLDGTADAGGRFALRLATPKCGERVRFEVQSGSSKCTVEDVLVGDVWLASGQSNMEMSLGPSSTSQQGVLEWEKEATASNLPELRLFTVARRISAVPLEDVDGAWSVCSKESAAAFSATALFFARDLTLRQKHPLGIVASSWGGTICEAWTRAEGLTEFAEFAPDVARLADAKGGELALAEQRQQYWDRVGASRPAPDARGWNAASLPHVWSKHGLGDFDGVGWYQRGVEVPAAWAGRDLVLMLGPIDDMDALWWDEVHVAGTYEPGHWSAPRQYRIPAERVRVGQIQLRIAALDTGGEGGISGSAEACRLQPAMGEGGSLGLDGGWSFCRGEAMGALPRFPASMQSSPNVPTVLWNGMIAPLVPFPFTGAIWYQGESNVGRALQYSRLFPAMIRDWRAAFGRDLAFLFVQIAPFGYGNDHGELFALRLAQEQALLLPRVGMAVTTDIGDARDIHPRQKRLVGERLAMAARRHAYGDLDPSLIPPRATSATVRGRDVVIHCDGVVGPWSCGEGGPSHFEVAGSDSVFHPAVARSEGPKLLLRCAAVEKPTQVRYAFQATAMADLWSEHGLPLPPFLMTIEAAKGD